MDQVQATPPDTKKYGKIALTIILWAIMVVLAMFSIFAVREILLWAIVAGLYEPGDVERRNQVANIASLAQQCFVIIAAVIGLAVVMFSTDKLFKQAGEPRLIRRLLIIIAIEAAIVLPTAYIFWL